jgi:hypothetical protein
MERFTLPIKKIIIVVLCLLLLFIAVVFVGGLVESNREQVHYDTLPIDQPISISALSFAELDRVMQSEYPQYCKGMELVEAAAEIQFRDRTMQQGEASLIYYRYIDESMEGGNVETNECHFDLVTNTFVSVEHWHGSGKSFSISEHGLDEDILKTPLDQYILHASELAVLQADSAYILRVDGAGNQMNVSFHTVNEQSPIYGETLTLWPENGKFAEREFSPNSN